MKYQQCLILFLLIFYHSLSAMRMTQSHADPTLQDLIKSKIDAGSCSRIEIGTLIKKCMPRSFSSLLAYAIEKQSKECIRELFHHCCILPNLPEQLRTFLTTPNLVFDDATTIIFLAILAYHTDTTEIDACVQLLKQHNISLDCFDTHGQTPLIKWVGVPRYGIVRSLLGAGCNPNIKLVETGETALHIARYSEMVDLLIRKGNANVHAQDNEGNTPLHLRTWPSYQSEPMVLKVLVAHGADVNAQDYKGNTPLHGSGNEWTILTLLRLGADPFIQNNKGESAIKITLPNAHTREIIIHVDDTNLEKKYYINSLAHTHLITAGIVPDPDTE